MNDYTDRILGLLKGCTQNKPLRGDDLAAELHHLTPNAINDLLDDLQGHGALNRAEITRDGETYTALWLTGIMPRTTSWMTDRDAGKKFSSLAAHNAQQNAEISRTEHKPETKPAPSKEATMTRIARPAQIVEQTTSEKPQSKHARRDQQMNTGLVQTAILESIKPGEELDVNEIFSRLKIETTHGSVGKTLELLEKRGIVQMAMRLTHKRWRRFFSLPGTDVETAHQTELCAELPGNLATLRKIVSDDQVAIKSPVIEPAIPTNQIKPMRSDEHATFAFYDDGALEIYQGDEAVMLQARQVARLVTFLGRIAA
jgi:hypothetical protein